MLCCLVRTEVARRGDRGEREREEEERRGGGRGKGVAGGGRS